MPYFEFEQHVPSRGAPLFSPLDWEGLRDEPTRLVLIRQAFENFIHYSFPITRETLIQKFLALADLWRKETVHLSSATQSAMHPAYQQIIGMGAPVIPLILKELEREPAPWFWALRAITGVDPVSPLDRGRIRAMAASWIRWGKEEGII